MVNNSLFTADGFNSVVISKAPFTLPDSTQLNSTGSWVELSRVVRVFTLPDAVWMLLRPDSTRLKIVSFLPVASLLVELSWVESRRAVWTVQKLLPTSRDPVFGCGTIAACGVLEIHVIQNRHGLSRHNCIKKVHSSSSYSAITIAAFLWARKVVFTSFSVGNYVSMKSEVVITSGKVGQADSIPSFRVGKTWRLSMIWKIKYVNLFI